MLGRKDLDVTMARDPMSLPNTTSGRVAVAVLSAKRST
jgi:hypothetical protein